jgi:CTP synthase (UTP-ammonia lyase)
MDRDLKIQDIVFAALFGALGIVALVAAVFYGKTHQFVMAAICAAMVAAAIIEIRREEKRAKQRQTPNIQ